MKANLRACAFLSCWFLIIGCYSPAGGLLDLRVRFAGDQAALIGEGGLPVSVLSYRLQARAGSSQADVVADSGCVDITADSPERYAAQLDLVPATDLVLLVSGYEASGCSGDPTWMGMSSGVTVNLGETTPISIYVTARGLRLNASRAAFPTPRAFATATALEDGRVLIAGGFELEPGTLPDGGGIWYLTAACDAFLYDPGTATFGPPMTLRAGCRGLHQAVSLPDGRILLVGGSSRLGVRLRAPLLIRSSDAVATAEVFDPADPGFSEGGPDEALRRTDVAAAALDDGRVILLGGRTHDLRSSDLVLGSEQSNGTWDWNVLATKLRTKRSGAQVASVSAGLLLVGGNAFAEGDSVEMIDPATLLPAVIQQDETAADLAGHTLTRINSIGVLLAGGIASYAGALPTDEALIINFVDSQPSMVPKKLAHARAYHAAALLPDRQILLVGGMDQNLRSARDLEVLPVEGPSRTLPDSLEGASVGIAIARLPDDSLLLAGGLSADAGGLTLSPLVQILSP